MAELLLGQPIFPGDSGVDQLVEIIKVRWLSYTFEPEMPYTHNPQNQTIQHNKTIHFNSGKRENDPDIKALYKHKNQSL